MKKSIALVALVLSMGSAYSQTHNDAALIYSSMVPTALTMAPFVYASQLTQATSAVTTMGPLATTVASVQRRGIAGKDQLRDELAALNDDMTKGEVKSIEEVRQPTLKEYFKEISSDEEQMKGINEAVPSGSQLLKISTAVTIVLMNE